MEFILQLMADLFLPNEIGKNEDNQNAQEIKSEQIAEVEHGEVVDAELDTRNIFSFVEFH